MTGNAPPRTIGPYRVLSRLGEGGMGEVFLAERKDLGQRVALKVIKLGMDTRGVLARFEAERQALARMEHSNIAKVLDAGATPEGRPYFVMEYVKGAPITRYCDDQKLSVEERLLLFKQVCSGVQHAHSKGVIHRDLTPNNVLVTVQEGKATAKIIDFGLARATDHRLTEKTLFTEQGVIMGTPEYMSPEQAGLGSLDIDTRTDVYTLGVMLYELLTGELPFSRDELRAVGYDAMCRTIREKEPEKPSTRITKTGTAKAAHLRRTESERLLKRLRGDLDWVVLKCLEKDRTRRYETPTHLADDLQRHLDDEPVMARAPSAGYRLHKLCRRYRGQLVAAGVVLVTLLAGLAGTTTFLFQARRHAKDAAKQTAEAQRQERIAAARATEAEARRQEAQRERAAKETALLATERALHRETGMRLIAQATLHTATNPGLAVALAVAGSERVGRAASERALRAALAASREVATTYLWEHDPGAEAPAVRASSNLTAVVRLDWPEKGAVTAWRLGAGAPPRQSVARVGDVALAGLEANHATLAPAGTSYAVAAADAVSVQQTFASGTGRRVPFAVLAPGGMAFDSTGTRLLLARPSGGVAMLEIDSARETTLAEGSEPVAAIACARAAPRALLHVGDRWEVHDLDRRERVVSFAAACSEGVLSDDGAMAVVWNDMQGTVVTWDLDRGRRSMSDPSQRVLSHAISWSLSPNSRLLAFGCGMGVLKVWDLHEGFVTTREARDGDVTALAFDAAGEHLAAGARNGTVRVHECATWAERVVLQGHVADVLGVRFATASEIVSVAADGTVRRWNIGEYVGRRPATARELHRLLDAFSPVDGAVFDLVKGRVSRLMPSDPGRALQEMSIIRGVGDPVQQIKWMVWPGAFAPDGKHVATTSLHDPEPQGHLLEAGGLRPVRALDVLMPAFSADGARLVGTGKEGLRVIEVAAGAPAVRLEASSEYVWPRFGPDGRYVLAAGSAPYARSPASMTVRVWDSASGTVVGTLASDGEPVLAAAMAPDSARAAGGGADGTVRVWDVATSRLLSALPGHRGSVYAVAFAPDGKVVASAGNDGDVRLWDLILWDEAGRITGAGDPVLAVAFSDDGEWVVLGTVGGEVAAVPRDPRALATARGLRALTPAECAQFEVGNESAQAAYRAAWRKHTGLDAETR